MNSDQNNSRLPARRNSDDAQIQPETDVQAVMGFLPKTGTIDEDERIPMARVGDGQAALDAISEIKPDLVLLDIMLPEIDGFEVCRRIKSDDGTKHIPVIMLTAKKSREDMARGEQVGADWYITKPFKSAMVIETIQRFID